MPFFAGRVLGKLKFVHICFKIMNVHRNQYELFACCPRNLKLLNCYLACLCTKVQNSATENQLEPNNNFFGIVPPRTSCLRYDYDIDPASCCTFLTMTMTKFLWYVLWEFIIIISSSGSEHARLHKQRR